MSNQSEIKCIKDVSFLIMTANVGTLFEDLSGLEDVWIREFTKLIKLRSPHFIALHFQEVGGKDYKTSMSHVDAFIEKILALNELEDFDTVRGYLDEDFVSVEDYTALGNFYFVHKSLEATSIWNYDKKEFTPAHGKEVCAKDLEKRSDFCKEKFEQGYFPDCKWSRKGYSRVRWKICNKVFEFVNIHLFHDDNNLIAIQTSPSSYSRSRKRALKFVLQRVNSDPPPNGNFFIFGDFNFRLDIKALVQKLCASSKQQVIRSQDNDDILRLLYRAPAPDDNETDSENDRLLLMIEKKVFHYDHKLLHKNGNYEQLRRFNEESEDLLTDLKEFSFNFAPTYPYSEKSGEGNEYMKTRCPAWCDRVFLSPHAWNWVNTEGDSITYDTIGKQVCMGDHKPIFLAFNASSSAFENDEEVNGETPTLVEESLKKTKEISQDNNSGNDLSVAVSEK